MFRDEGSGKDFCRGQQVSLADDGNGSWSANAVFLERRVLSDLAQFQLQSTAGVENPPTVPLQPGQHGPKISY